MTAALPCKMIVSKIRQTMLSGPAIVRRPAENNVIVARVAIRQNCDFLVWLGFFSGFQLTVKLVFTVFFTIINNQRLGTTHAIRKHPYRPLLESEYDSVSPKGNLQLQLVRWIFQPQQIYWIIVTYSKS